MNDACTHLKDVELRVHHQLESLGGVKILQNGRVVVHNRQWIEMSDEVAVVDAGMSVIVHNGCHQQRHAVRASNCA